MRKPVLLTMMLVLALSTAALAACGGSSKSSGGGGGSTSTSTSSGGSGGGSTTSGGGTDVSNNPQVQAAVTQCKSAIDQQPTLKASTKTDLKNLCDKAASGNIKDIQDATRQVCEKIVDDTVPDSAGAAKDQAKAACKSAGG